MKITGSVVTYNNDKTIDKCLETVLGITKDKDYDFSLYVYDNASTDDTISIITSKYPQVKLIKSDENKGFGAGHNAIIKRVKSDYHFVINPDMSQSLQIAETQDYGLLLRCLVLQRDILHLDGLADL